MRALPTVFALRRISDRWIIIAPSDHPHHRELDCYLLHPQPRELEDCHSLSSPLSFISSSSSISKTERKREKRRHRTVWPKLGHRAWPKLGHRGHGPS